MSKDIDATPPQTAAAAGAPGQASTATEEGMESMRRDAQASCNFLVRGYCMTSSCLRRAGYSALTRDQFTHDEWIERATCIEREFLRLTEAPQAASETSVTPTPEGEA